MVMDTESYFVVRERCFDGQYIREYPGALAGSQEDTLQLHAKQYIPRELVASDGTTTAGDVTVIGFHANAFHKEIYEPFWADLHACMRNNYGVLIGSIWIADQAFMGQSAVLNEGKLGNDPHWFDHARDVLNMVNTFRKEMTRPIVGVGHSMGGAQAVAVAHYHPRLFTSLVLIDPPMTGAWVRTTGLIIQVTVDKPQWFPSQQAAMEATRKNPFFKRWDKRAVQRYCETAWKKIGGGEGSEAVSFTTSPQAELAHTVRANPNVIDNKSGSPEEQYLYPDVDWTTELSRPVYQPAIQKAFSFLPTLRPSALYIIGKGSQFTPPEVVEERTRITGSGVGGSGGVERGKVAQRVVTGGHFLPMTNPVETAKFAAEWLSADLTEWRRIESEWLERWHQKSLAEKQQQSPQVVKLFKQWNGKPWPRESAPSKL
ncbi:prolyl aminopeptidase-like protein [Polychaeton citri CBS 116435]|uniref:Prolyl aminopeptidase-like protein n=1 Tax=Polychaeton citri CBS 116435 TaxID=1314669 RepID=A0A9P4ULK9_9PEZI|nr:prolyl aminopeptidase-like protein [Polychaeton citri CBS 116435]